jgi:ubiquinone/menaquinone biosynthesis methyltransferase
MENVQEIFSDIAPRYDCINSVLSLTADHWWRKQAVAKLKNKKRVLDLCAGTLAMSKALLDINPTVKIDAVDFSAPMLAYGIKKLPVIYQSHISTHCQDALKLDFPENTFDGAQCAYGLRNISDNATVLRHLRKVLKPGGKLVILDFYAPEKAFAKFFQATYAYCVIPIVGRLISKNRAAYRHLRDSMKNYYTPTSYRALLEFVGFKNVKVTPQLGGISYLITGVAP